MSQQVPLPGRIRAWLRIIALIGVLAWYILRLKMTSLFVSPDEKLGFRYRRNYTRVAMRILGVHLRISGRHETIPGLYVSNHRSLLDPVIGLHFIDAYIVSKAEVAAYPLIGYGSSKTGVVFVKRENKESRMATREAIRDLLIAGKAVMIYPEGTTSDADTTIDFKPGAFEIAAETGVPVVPVAIQYASRSNHWADGPMLPFFIRKFSNRKIDVSIAFGEPIRDHDPEMLLRKSQSWINARVSVAASDNQ